MKASLYLLPYSYLSYQILQRFTVRIHSRIVEKGRAWARLWYLLRGLDQEGSGFVAINLAEICEILTAGESTVYQWLREGQAAGAIHWWECKDGKLRIRLNSLVKLSRSLGLKPEKGLAAWGAVAEVGLHEILSLKKIRSAATVATTQRLQELSRFAAWKSLSRQARKCFKLPRPDAFFVEGKPDLSVNNAKGRIPCCIHISKHRIWASRGFIPFGASQNAIARERNISDRTVRRHLDALEIDRRQIVQSKSEYKAAHHLINHNAGSDELSDAVSLLATSSDEYLLNERSGTVGRHHIVKVGEVGFNQITNRFFQYGKTPKYWIYRCNLYNPTLKLCTMSAARRRYAKTVLQKSSVAGCSSLVIPFESSLENSKRPTPSQADKGGHFS